MHAIILAAGQGKRLAEFIPKGLPKCLLEIGGRSLLSRQLEALYEQGIRQVTLVVGYAAEAIIEHVGTLAVRPEVALVYNPAYNRGSVLSLAAAKQVMTSSATVLVLNADVLFHPQIVQSLVGSEHQNCFLVDRDFEPGNQPVKIAVRNDRIVEFRKTLPAGLEFETLGTSVGFFKFDGNIAVRIAQVCDGYRSEGLLGAPHEEALRDIALALPAAFACEDITGLPWIELNIPEAVESAIKHVLPAIKADIADF